ncbi:hypothetical protein QZH41_006308 [Actinostola sp. cb2023]|nr:hypothetical protein QZH41_006308 [Actinostola sp. cb2023]
METMEQLEKEIDAKLKLLDIKQQRIKDIVEKKNEGTIQRHRSALETLSREVGDYKLKIEEGKLASGQSAEEVCAWSEEIDNKLERVDEEIEYLAKCLTECKQHDSISTKEKEISLLALERQRQLEFERAQLELKFEYQKKGEELKKSKQGDATTSYAKLPKLTITKFNGTFEEWLSFWNKFTVEIDSTDLAPVTKFAYLKELVEPKVRANIDGLPFSTEGYERAKNILKSEYGKSSEIVNAYVSNIMELPTITSSNPKRVDEFYKKLLYNVQSLETLGKLRDVSGNARAVLDKLRGIKADLVRGEENWQEWDFVKLLQAIKRWRDINPVEESMDSTPHKSVQPSRTRVFNTLQGGEPEVRGRGCVYCDDESHKGIACTKVQSRDERKKILARKKLCFNCTGAKHQANDCRSKKKCQECGRKHHTSICDQDKSDKGQLMVATGNDDNVTRRVTYPVVVVEAGGIKCRALLDTGAGSSYASAALLNRIPRRECKTQVRKIEMLLGVSTKEIELSTIEVKALSGQFKLSVEVTKVDKSELLYLDNPKYEELIKTYSHLKGIEMADHDEKDQLPVHLILGAGEFAKLKVSSPPKIGQPGEPVGELTRFGWTIMSSGTEPVDLSTMLMTQTSHVDYEELCRLDVLGLQDTPTNDQGSVYEEFKEQLTRDKEGWYETGLPWKGDHRPLPNNKEGSLRRLSSLTRKLERQTLTEKYGEIIDEQKATGVVESAEIPAVGREFYIPHKPVVRAEAESTKLRIVYDASARAYDSAPSLNECLHAGPPLQNKLWNVLVRGRFNPVALTGDLQKAFLQVRVRESDRDAMRFHWRRNEQSELETLRFTRALFGLAPSPFLLGGVIETHLSSWEEREPEVVRKVRRELYVDDLISGSTSVSKALELKEKATIIFQDAGFKLHKWHSNAQELVESAKSSADDDTYAKQQLGTPPGGDCSLLGLGWNTNRDTLSVEVPQGETVMTKRGILAKLAKVYDPLGLVSPITLSGKIIYRSVCDDKIGWDVPLPEPLAKMWRKWESSLPKEVELPRSLAIYRDDIESIELHAFGDASANGVAACVYAVLRQASGTNQGLVAARSRLSKQGLTIPRLELVAGHMAVNLVTNVSTAIQGFPVSTVHCWLDSTVALHWIQGQGEYKQFVENRVRKIKSHQGVTWRHVPTGDNPADLASRGGGLSDAKLWWSGPQWLSNTESWPADIVPEPTTESKAENKIIRNVLSVAVEEENVITNLLTNILLTRQYAWCRGLEGSSTTLSQVEETQGNLVH